MGTVKKVAGISPDANGNISKEELESVLDITPSGENNFIINISKYDEVGAGYFNFILDKTFSEIFTAVNEHKNILIYKDESAIYGYTDDYLSFGFLLNISDENKSLTILTDGEGNFSSDVYYAENANDYPKTNSGGG